MRDPVRREVMVQESNSRGRTLAGVAVQREVG